MASADDTYRLILQVQGQQELEELTRAQSAEVAKLREVDAALKGNTASQADYDAQLARTRAATESMIATQERVTTATKSYGNAILQASRAGQDYAQGGFAGALNNIEGIVAGLGPKLAAFAGPATAIATVGFVIYQNWSAISSLWETRNPFPKAGDTAAEFKDQLDKANKELDKLKEKTELSNEELARFNTLKGESAEAQEKYNKAKERENALEALRTAKTEQQTTQAGLVDKAITENGGLEPLVEGLLPGKDALAKLAADARAARAAEVGDFNARQASGEVVSAAEVDAHNARLAGHGRAIAKYEAGPGAFRGDAQDLVARARTDPAALLELQGRVAGGAGTPALAGKLLDAARARTPTQQKEEEFRARAEEEDLRKRQDLAHARREKQRQEQESAEAASQAFLDDLDRDDKAKAAAAKAEHGKQVGEAVSDFGGVLGQDSLGALAGGVNPDQVKAKVEQALRGTGRVVESAVGDASARIIDNAQDELAKRLLEGGNAGDVRRRILAEQADRAARDAGKADDAGDLAAKRAIAQDFRGAGANSDQAATMAARTMQLMARDQMDYGQATAAAWTELLAQINQSRAAVQQNTEQVRKNLQALRQIRPRGN